MVNKKLTLMKMNKLNEYYLDKYGTDRYDDFKEFMIDKEIPVNTLEFMVK